MTFYQELQLNQAGSKSLIRNETDPKKKAHHIWVYLFKILITLAFCMAFVTFFTIVFGSENSIVGVVVLLFVMVFRFADFGICTSHSLLAMIIIFAILTAGPRLTNMTGPFLALLINIGCILLLMILGCHNVMMANHSTIVLGYLLLQGYDVTGAVYHQRIAAMILGGAITCLVFYHTHRKISYKRTMKDLFAEFRPVSTRTRWQLLLTLGIASILFLADLLNLPRAMWAGIAAMSVMLPFKQDMTERVKSRIPGNIIGGAIFVVLYFFLPKEIYAYIGIIGGIGVGLSATYCWQSVFNTFGALSIATGMFGLPAAVFLRILNNAFGALYGLFFHKLFHISEKHLEPET